VVKSVMVCYLRLPLEVQVLRFVLFSFPSPSFSCDHSWSNCSVYTDSFSTARKAGGMVCYSTFGVSIRSFEAFA